MEPARELAAEHLIAALNRLRQDAGGPSLSELVQLSQHTLSRSTLHDHLAGRRTRLPPWRLVAAYVSACHAAAASTGLNVERLGTLEEWHDRWLIALNAEGDVLSSAGEPNGGSSSSALGAAPFLDLNETTEFKPQPVMESQATPGEHGDTIASTSIAPVIQRLEESLSELGKTLPAYTGLLIVTSGPTIGARFTVEHNITTIGRAPDSDIWLNDPTVSRHHAAIYRRGEKFVIRDAGSRNGIVLRGQVIKSDSPLSSYEEVGIAAFTLMFLQGGEKAKKSRKNYQPIRSRLLKETTGVTAEWRAFVQHEGDRRPDVPGRGIWRRRRRWARGPSD